MLVPIAVHACDNPFASSRGLGRLVAGMLVVALVAIVIVTLSFAVVLAWSLTAESGATVTAVGIATALAGWCLIQAAAGRRSTLASPRTRG